MPRLLALEWDDNEARVAIAEASREGMVLEQAFSVTMPRGVPANGPVGSAISASGGHDLGGIGRKIGEALAAHGFRRGKTLVAVGRTNIELKNLTLPPAPPEELPEMVRFQAEREFNTLSDDWPLDYIPIPGESADVQTVLAAAISPELVSEIQITCQAANIEPERLILRPCAAASLLSRAKPAAKSKLRLLVDLLADEADLTVLDGDSVVFLRTARLSSEMLQTEPLRALLPEIRRTIAAVHNRLKGDRIQEVILCGEGPNQSALASEIGRELELPAEVFNPLAYCKLSPELRRAMPEHPSRFAPLVGMLLDEAAGVSNTIDFLNPRRKPKPRSFRKEATWGGAVAGALAIVIAGWMWLSLSNLESQADELKKQSDALDPQVKQGGETEKRAAAIEKELAGDVVWLDELAVLSTKLPSAQDVMLNDLTIYDDPSKTPSIKFGGFARNVDVDRQLKQSLRDSRHDVVSPGTKADDSHKPYGLSFSANVDLHSADKSALPGRSTPPRTSGVNTARPAPAATPAPDPASAPSPAAGTEAQAQ